MTFAVAYDGVMSGATMVSQIGNISLSGALVSIPYSNGQRVIILKEV